MTAPIQRVDVRAVMQAEIDALERRVLNGELPLSSGYDEVNKKRAALAAVAELIESTAAEYAAQAAYDNAATGKRRNETWDAVLDARKRRITAFLNAGGSAA